MRPLHGFSLLALTSTLALCLVPSLADAQAQSPRQRASAHTQKGSKYQKLGEFDKAIAEYQLAYDLVPHPQLLYNLAQAYRLKGDKKKALETYQTFVSIETNTAAAEKARGFITLLKEAIAAEPATTPSEPATVLPATTTEPLTAVGDQSVSTTAGTAERPQGPPAVIEAPVAALSSNPLDRHGVQLGAAFSFVQHDYGDGVGPSFQVGYELAIAGIGVRPGARVDYFLIGEENGDDTLLHIGAETRVRKTLFGRVVPFATIGVGVTHFTADGGDGGEYASTMAGFHFDAGVEVLVFDRFALGAMFLADGIDTEGSVAGGGFTLTRY